MIDLVHFDPASGEIMQISRSNVPQPFNGWRVGQLAPGELRGVSHVTHRVDIAHVGSEAVPVVFLIAKSAAEQRAARRPLLIDLRVARNAELTATDGYVAGDRPILETERAAWLAYRQVLRELGRHAAIEDWLAAWPARPDGRDAAAHWREHARDAR